MKTKFKSRRISNPRPKTIATEKLSVDVKYKTARKVDLHCLERRNLVLNACPGKHGFNGDEYALLTFVSQYTNPVFNDVIKSKRTPGTAGADSNKNTGDTRPDETVWIELDMVCERFGWDEEYLMELIISLSEQGYFVKRRVAEDTSVPERICIDYDVVRDFSHVGFASRYRCDRLIQDSFDIDEIFFGSDPKTLADEMKYEPRSAAEALLIEEVVKTYW